MTTLSPQERKEKIERYGSAYDLLTQALAQFPREMWTFKPAAGWSIHQIVVHITDSEANSFVRCRRLLAEPGSEVLGYDEMRWATQLDYESQSTDLALELFRWLRRASYELIKDAPPSIGDHWVQHSESGKMMFDQWLDTYDRHVPEHIEQMQRAHDEWARSAHK